MPSAAEAHLRRDARLIFDSALQAADAAQAVSRHVARAGDDLQANGLRLHLPDYERISLLAVGKAAVPMATALERILAEPFAQKLIVTKHGHAGAALADGVVIETGHPIPDEAGEHASHLVKRLVAALGRRDLLLVAISGGASALLPAPAEGITLAAKRQTTDLLLKAGADIGQLNAVRKHLSFLKGGYLAQLAFPATVVSLLLSDVIGDPLDVIGSGPTAPDESTFADALAVIERFDLLERIPPSVRNRLTDGAAGLLAETPKPGDPVFQNVYNIVVGSNRLALEAAAAKAQALGYETRILSDAVQGESREVAASFARTLRESIPAGHAGQHPVCLLAGGESTVTVRGEGKGGRNQEFALAAAIALAGLDNVAVLSAGTDGTDGPTDAAGALATGTTTARAAELGLSAAAHLAANDSYHFFDALGDLLRTGPTGTNVMDIHLLLAR